MTSLAPAPSPAPAAGADTALRAARRAGTVQRKFPLLQLLVLIALIVFVGNRDGNYGWADLWAPILLQASFLGIASAAQTLAILVGGLDFSIAAYIVAGNLLTTHLSGLEHWNFGFVARIVLVICLVCGGASGWVCHRFGLEPLVVTLGMSSVVVGALLGTIPPWSTGRARAGCRTSPRSPLTPSAFRSRPSSPPGSCSPSWSP